LTPEYLAHAQRGWRRRRRVSEYGIQLSRGFRHEGLAVVQEHGLRKYARLIEQNIGAGTRLAELVLAAPELSSWQ
jgi:hypothetical protein